MRIRPNLTVPVLCLSVLILTGCNLPSRQVPRAETPTSTNLVIPEASPTPTSLCKNQYFPSKAGDTWEYSGTNSAIGEYTRADTITASGADSFTQQTTLASVTYSVNYACTPQGLIASDPVQQYVGALLTGPNAPLNVKLTFNTGISIPSIINPGDTWQQMADWEATSSDFNLTGRFVFDYTAVGFENVTVALGTFNALRVDATIRIEVSGLRILAGTYTLSTWVVPDIGMIKSEGTSHVPGVEFMDAMQLTRFSAAP